MNGFIEFYEAVPIKYSLCKVNVKLRLHVCTAHTQRQLHGIEKHEIENEHRAVDWVFFRYIDAKWLWYNLCYDALGHYLPFGLLKRQQQMKIAFKLVKNN